MNENRTTTYPSDPVDLTLSNHNLQQTIKMALSEAVQTLYFDDSADCGTTLWQIVNILGGEEAVNMLEKDCEKAYEKYCG